MKQLIKNVHILTMDQIRTEIPAGFLLIEDDQIAAIGSMENELPKADKVIDGKQGILLPGMINTHTHVGMIPFRSLGDDVPDRLRRFLFPLEKNMTRQLVTQSAKYAVAEMLLAGVTSFCDMYYFEDAIAEAVAEMGSRALLGETIIDMETPDAKTCDEAFLACKEFIHRWQNHPLIQPIIAPHAPNTNRRELLREIADFSRKEQIPVMMHVAEMDYEIQEFAEKYQQTPIEFLRELGYFDAPFIMAHAIHLTPSDIELLQSFSENVKIAHCIGANTKAAKGIAPIPELLQHGLTVGLGTDGPSSGNTLDLFTQMKLTANFHKTNQQDRSLFPAKEIVAMATIEGAKVLGLNQLVGSLEIGKKADLTLVETQSVNMFPIFDAYSALVYSANASNVTDVWVNGVHKVADKQLVKEDLSELRQSLTVEMTNFVVEARKRA